ncbi:PKD domain-containing protein [Methanogenium cariaci]|uniref:PKD domain-containing protein n=1 Tax=Methanogenium cariaci TaxID=2197 RepID=UPI0007836C4F|nr:PKD domain-containing protein [Methanogenium cariaci]
MPAWASLSSNGTLPASSVWIKTSDLNKEIQPGAVNVPMGTITVTGLATGVADLPLAVARMDDDDGLALTPETGTAAFSVNQLPAQVADFRANVTSGTDPLMVQFTDLSTGEDITAWAWDFDNDGTTDSTEENPAYTYDTAGVYTVNLTVTNSGGTSTETKADYITVDAVILHLDFDPLTSAVGRGGESTVYSITLDSAPTGLSGYNLTVSLSDDTVGEITAVDLPAWASLSSNGTLPASSVWIKASDLNKEIQPGAVNVPMGTITVTGLATGVADLSLAIARMDDDNGFALNPETGTAAFSVNQLPAPVADFRADVTSGTDPLMVQFTDLSTGEDITAWAWDFDNDGTTDSTEENPAYTYDTAGVYTVNLTVTNKGGSSTETKADYITVDAVILHLDFDPVLSEVDQGESATYAITLDTVPDGLSGYNLTVSLSDDTVGEIIAVDLPAWASLSSNGTLPASSVWIKATDLNKEIQQGAENVPMGTVTVTGLAPGAADLSLDVARIDNDDGFALNPETGTAAFSVDMPAPVADFNAYVTSGTCPLAVQFTDLSAGEDITAWAWDFNNDGTIDSTEQNPVHTYTNIGLFTVTLEVSNTGGADVLTRSRYITVRDVPPVPPESSEDFTFDNNGTTFTDIGDQQQVSFNSSVCNGTVDGDNILLRNGKMNVTISTYGLSTIGDVSTGNVSSVLLESSPVNAPPLGREVGNVSVGFNATMNNYNPDLGITTSIFDQPSAEASKVFTLAAADEKLSITSTAYAVYFTKTNLTEENGLRNAFLEMTVSPKWVKTNGGIGAIRVFRQGDDGGVTQILDTTYLGINADGMMVFKAFSPDGFSSFAVAATAASATPVSVGDDSDDSSELSAASAGNLKAGETKTLSISNSPVTQIGLEMQSAVSSLLVTVTDERNSPAGGTSPPRLRCLALPLFRTLSC